MRISRRSRGILEYQTNKIRLRFQPIPDTQHFLLIIHQLRPNGYIRTRIKLEIDDFSELSEMMDVFQVFAQTSAQAELETE